ncbi:MAG: 3-deoxy-manno-octulosonate-8-phosphatase KdsC [Sedimenticola sp.]|nr:3-deoxy-manno-octulosonate-8-phosphatase KdsC [Sedimenticola sp.]
MQKIFEQAQRIKLVIFDVDGVLTDGTLFLGDDGQEYKAFNSKDGFGMKLLLKSGIDIGIITARTSDVVKIRMKSLGIKYVFQGQQQKAAAYESLRDDLGLTNEQIAYVGDDVVDLPVMQQVGLAITVQDGHPLVKQQAHWQTQQPGGRGAAREVCELIMQAQGTLEHAFGQFTGQ